MFTFTSIYAARELFYQIYNYTATSVLVVPEVYEDSFEIVPNINVPYDPLPDTRRVYTDVTEILLGRPFVRLDDGSFIVFERWGISYRRRGQQGNWNQIQIVSPYSPIRTNEHTLIVCGGEYGRIIYFIDIVRGIITHEIDMGLQVRGMARDDETGNIYVVYIHNRIDVFDAAIRIRLATFTTDIVPHNIVINGESLYLLSVPRDRRSSVVVVDKMTGERAFEIPIPSARKVKKMLKMENDNIVVLVENEIFVMYNTPDTKPARAIAYEQS